MKTLFNLFCIIGLVAIVTIGISHYFPQVIPLLPWSPVAVILGHKDVINWIRDLLYDFFLKDYAKLKEQAEGNKAAINDLEEDIVSSSTKLIDLMGKEHRSFTKELAKVKEDLNNLENKLIQIEASIQASSPGMIAKEIRSLKRSYDLLKDELLFLLSRVDVIEKEHKNK